MSNTTLPPQAFTKEMLSEAFDWLNLQPDAIKNQVKSTEGMMSLYLRHKRHGKVGFVSESVSEQPPASIRHFQSDLKNLAEGLKQFDPPRQESPAKPQASPKASTYQSIEHTRESTKVTQSTSTAGDFFNDPNIISMLEWTQQRFNLSTKEEAARMLITIGQEQIEKLFPR